MKTKVFKSKNLIATCVITPENKVYVHWNYLTEQSAVNFEDEATDLESDVIYRRIEKWCDNNNLTLWSY